MNNEPYHFNFPKITIGNEEFHLLEQCYKVEEEAKEITEAFASGSITNPIELVTETFDCIHACETLLNWVLDYYVHGGATMIDMCYQAVISKNSERGYYDD